jgi:meso-butanediol dehydrogenase/(S,S)-butanediol dehydrogenase/diacetyl reductase
VTLAGKVALVTGGAAGIGAGIVERLAAEGAAVVAADRDPDTDEWEAVRASAGDRVHAIRADVQRDEDVENAIGAAVERYGGLDVVVNNAGILRFTPIAELARADWDAVIGLNLSAPAFTAKAALPRMRARGGGVIVNVSSIQAVLTGPQFAAYAASKAGLLGLTRSLALELGPLGIRVNAVLPGYTRTPLFMSDAVRLGNGDPDRWIEDLEGTIALRRIGEPADVADVVAFLCGDGARYVTGSALAVDAGVTVQL